MKQRKQRDIATIALDLEDLATEFRDAYHRSDAPKPGLTFEQRVILASQAVQKGSPLRDSLECWEIEQAVNMLADIFVVTGIKLPADY